MARYKPVRDSELAQITGVTQEKVRKYAYDFTDLILAFIREKKNQVASLDIDTHKLSLQLYQTGLTPQQIADKRGLKIDTIVGHLIKLYNEDGAEVDFWKIITKAEYDMIIDGVVSIDLKKGDALKPLYEYLNEAYEYYKLRVALMLWEKEESEKEKEKEKEVKINFY
jgi:ATP-dependent DNA helicase RecQ